MLETLELVLQMLDKYGDSDRESLFGTEIFWMGGILPHQTDTCHDTCHC